MYSVFRNVQIYDQRKGWQSVRVDLELDLDAIALELGKKALSNKSRKSKLAIGVTAEARVLSNEIAS